MLWWKIKQRKFQRQEIEHTHTHARGEWHADTFELIGEFKTFSIQMFILSSEHLDVVFNSIYESKIHRTNVYVTTYGTCLVTQAKWTYTNRKCDCWIVLYNYLCVQKFPIQIGCVIVENWWNSLKNSSMTMKSGLHDIDTIRTHTPSTNNNYKWMCYSSRPIWPS